MTVGERSSRQSVVPPMAGPPMAPVVASELVRVHTQNAHLKAENKRLRAENQELRSETGRLQAALDVHRARFQAAGLFGPLELTAGTCVGPRRQARTAVRA